MKGTGGGLFFFIIFIYFIFFRKPENGYDNSYNNSYDAAPASDNYAAANQATGDQEPKWSSWGDDDEKPEQTRGRTPTPPRNTNTSYGESSDAYGGAW